MKTQKLTYFIDILYYIGGSVIYASALLLFISSNKISPGGVTGIGTMLNYLFDIPIGIVVFLINIPLLIIGFMKFGGIFIIKTTIATAIFSLIIDILERLIVPIKIDLILSALFGGSLMGLGLSIIMLRGATTGGVDIVAKVINRRFPHMSIGKLVLFTDAAVVAASVFVYKNLQSALYSAVTLYFSSKIMDIMLYGGDKGKIVYIITSNHEKIVEGVLSLVKRGVTVIDAVGGYTGKPKKMIMCTVRKYEVNEVYKTVKDNDKDAFIIVSDAGEVIGQGFKRE